MAGAMLVMVVGIALAVAASVGNLMICQNRARSLADLIAFDAAYALWHADIGDPCALAANMAEANGVVLGSCSVRDEDVLVTIKVEPWSWWHHRGADGSGRTGELYGRRQLSQ